MLLNRVLKTSAVLLIVVALGTGTGLAVSQASKTDSQERKATSAEQRTAEAKAQAPSVIQSTAAGRDTHPSRGTDSQKVSDSDKLQGSWIVVSDEYFGRTEKAGPKDRLVIARSRFIMESDGEATEKGTFTIDEAKKPKTIDFSITESPLEGRKGNKILGIYAVEGDTLRICWTEIGGTDRPTDFVADTKHEDYNLLTYKRQKVTSQETPLQKEWKRLEGDWKAVAYESDGEKIEGEAFNKSEIGGDVLTIQEGKRITKNKGGQLEVSLKIDPTATPKTMEVTATVDGKTQVGRSIYELDGDTLRICSNFENGGVLPKGFTAKGSFVMVYKRENRRGK